jgi:hypothetical protein
MSAKYDLVAKKAVNFGVRYGVNAMFIDRKCLGTIVACPKNSDPKGWGRYSYRKPAK